MPVSTFLGLQTTLRGLLAQQRALDVTSHNIANANTEGYTRQEALMSASDALQIGGGANLTDSTGSAALLGTGVDITQFRRLRDAFLDVQFRAQNTRLGDANAQSTALDRVELAFAEPSDNGISKQLAKFWSAWSDVANAPESSATRQSLVEQAKTLTSSLNQLYSQMETVRRQSRDEFDSITAAGTGEVAMAVDDIVRLTDTIQRQMAIGAQPNDLLDKRDALIDKLSGLAQVSVKPAGPAGGIEITFGDAALPVVTTDPATGAPISNWPQAITSAAGGKLGQLLTLSDAGGTIDSFKSDLDKAALELRDAVNFLHNPPPGTGVNFFAGTGAADISVNATAATVVTSFATDKGANDVARAIAALRGAPSGRAGGPYPTTDQLYNQLVARVGGAVKGADRQQSNAQALSDAVEERRGSMSGVSMDEEMTNIIRFQRAFQASARAMSTMDDVLDQIINRTGRVGL
ncbi:MAG: flagellar hook-associated protein FlgK [Thermoleophilaceae bacterium]